jgi:hypothetical protein
MKIFKTVCPAAIMGFSIMITDFLTKKFIECEYRIRFGLKCCSDCDVSFECDESHRNGSFIDDWEQPLFETFGRIFAPVAIDVLPC